MSAAAEPIAFDEGEAARRLGISPRTLFQIRKAGDISFRQIGALVRYTQADLTDYLNRVRVERGPTNGNCVQPPQ
jgi:hypothetical protein